MLCGEKVEQDLVRIIDRPVRRWKTQLPFEARHSQLARVLGLVVIDDCQGDATLEGREGQTCPLIGRIVAAIRDRPSGLARKRAKHRVHFSKEALDNPTSVNCALVPGSDGDPEVGASFRKGTALKFLGGVHDDLLRAAMHHPRVRDPAFGQPVILAAYRVGKAQGDREPGRTLEGQTEADDGTRRHIGGDGQIRSANEDAMIVDHLDELDVGRGMIDLDDLKGVGGTDIPDAASGGEDACHRKAAAARSPLG